MIKFEHTEVNGWEASIRGMRNPMNAWDKIDSHWVGGDENGEFVKDHFVIGKNDLDRMKKLRKAGTDHRKYLRMINVTVDITAPLYWWKEFDTYKVGTVANSCSTMHKITAKRFTEDDFSTDHLEDMDFYIDDAKIVHGFKNRFDYVIDELNAARDLYLYIKSVPMKNESARAGLLKRAWWQIIQWLPTTYNQKRTIQFNYEVLNNIYKSRQNHKLDEWREGFMGWIESLPYAKELIIGDDESEERVD